jgi:hypothetical protein
MSVCGVPVVESIHPLKFGQSLLREKDDSLNLSNVNLSNVADVINGFAPIHQYWAHGPGLLTLARRPIIQKALGLSRRREGFH